MKKYTYCNYIINSNGQILLKTKE